MKLMRYHLASISIVLILIANATGVLTAPIGGVEPLAEKEPTPYECKICTDPATNDCIAECYEQTGYGRSCLACGLGITVDLVIFPGMTIIIEGTKYIVTITSVASLAWGAWCVYIDCKECMEDSAEFKNCVDNCPQCSQWRTETCYVEY